MLLYQKEILDEKLPFMLDNLVLDTTFIAHATSCQLLSEESIEEVQAQDTQRKQIRLFINFLKRQASKKFNVFMAILKLTKQSHIFKEIDKERCKKNKHLPKSPEVENNTRQKLFSDFVPSRLSTQERDQLAKLFVLKEDYEEMNEDKHIQIQENEQLQMQLKDAERDADYERKHHQSVKKEYDKLKREKEELEEDYGKMNEDKHIQIQVNKQLQLQLKDTEREADYERKHHQSVKEDYDKLKRENEALEEDYEEMNEDKHIQIQENKQLQLQLKGAEREAAYERKHHQSLKEDYDKLKRENEELSNECIKQKQAIFELQQKIEEQQQKEKDYLMQIDQHKRNLENMEQLLQDIQNKQNIQEKRKMSKKSTDIVDSTTLVKMIDTEDEIFEKPSELKVIQQHIENLRNTAHGYEDINQNKLCSLQNELRKVDYMIHNILENNLDEKFIVQTKDAELAQVVVLSESENTFNKENPILDTVNVKIRPKPKQHKRDSHHREKGRHLNIETELLVLKRKFKTIEIEREEQNDLLKTKEKQLKEWQRQVVSLRQTLRSYKGTPQQHQHTNRLRTQQSNDYNSVYNPPQTTSIDNISFEPSHRLICESENYIHMKKQDNKPTALSLSLSMNCLKTKSRDRNFPKLSQNFLVSKSQTTSLLEYNDKHE